MKEKLAILSKIWNQQLITMLISITTIAILVLFSNYNIYSILGIGISIFLTIRLLLFMDYNIPVIEIMLLIAASQWIIGPFIDYQTNVTHHKMHMYVTEMEYMQITVPLFFIFVIASLKFQNFNVLNTHNLKKWLKQHKTVPIFIIIVGFGFRVIIQFLPTSLAFISYLTVNSALVGLGLFYFTNAKLKIKLIVTAVTFAPVLYHAISTGMFHILIIWGLFIFIFINLALKLSLSRKIIVIITSIFLMSTLQLVKGNYREIIYAKNFTGNKVDVFFDLLLNPDNTAELEDEENINNVNIRLNQGWIISKIYNEIPAKKDFLNGETVISAIEALVPRFLFPNKKVGGGGRDSFIKLTGLKIQKNTAMGVSLMGEFYGNYGFYGGILAFLIWGMLLKLVVSNAFSIQLKYPIIIFWLPIIFFQVIKAETDLTTVLNHLVKSIVFVSLFMFFIIKYFKINN